MLPPFPEMNVSVGPRRRSCVIDPALALARPGLPVLKRLGEFLDIWIPCELWRILDNTHFYIQRPGLLGRYGRNGAEAANAVEREVIETLRAWEQLRFNTDLGRLKMFWIGDGVGESLLPADIDTDILFRYERLNQSLDQRRPPGSPLESASRDAVALAAALPAAFVLSFRPPPSEMPGLLSGMQGWNIPFRELAANETLVALERSQVQELLVRSGVACFCWAGLRLAVVHLVTPSALNLVARTDPDGGFGDDILDAMGGGGSEQPDYWGGAMAFWYGLD